MPKLSIHNDIVVEIHMQLVSNACAWKRIPCKNQQGPAGLLGKMTGQLVFSDCAGKQEAAR